MKQEKSYLSANLIDGIDRHGAFVILNYKEVKANDMNQFRRSVAASGGDVVVMNKRILMKACAIKNIDVAADQLPGHIGVVLGGTDPIETTKIAFKFCSENDKKVNVLCGMFEGKVYNGQDVKMLSELPSKDEMRAQLLGTFEAPMAQTLAVMEALLSSVVYCLDNKCKGQESTEA